MDTVLYNGIKYTKTSKAAKNAGYTSDYVGQLCRGKKIDCRLVGRSWYVNEEDLQKHKRDSKRSSRVKARKQVHEAVKESKTQKESLSIKQSDTSFKRADIQYESDAHDLIPIPNVQKFQNIKEKEDISPLTTVKNSVTNIAESRVLIKDKVSPDAKKYPAGLIEIHEVSIRKDAQIETLTPSKVGLQEEKEVQRQVKYVGENATLLQQKSLLPVTLWLLTLTFILSISAIFLEITWSYQSQLI